MQIRAGDSIAVPFSVVSWYFNDGAEALEVLFLDDTSKAHRLGQFTSQLAAARTSGIRPSFSRHRVRIRHNRIVDDAFQELSVMSAEELKGVIRVTFFNESGEEEAGVDGGGLFKDFMENVTRTAFDIQYGLFKVSYCYSTIIGGSQQCCTDPIL